MRLKLLYITNQICSAAGLERVLSIKASYLADVLNYEVHILTLNQASKPLFYTFSDKLILHDISVKGSVIKYFYEYASRIRTKVKEIKPDIISVCDDGLKGFFVPYIVKNKIPILYERHASKNIFINSDAPSLFQKLKIKILNFLMHVGARKFDAFVVLTKDNLNEWHLNNLKVIPNPLSFYPGESALLTNKKVISVGNHGFQKGYDRLLRSWDIVLKTHPDWQLEIYGKINNALGYQELAEELGVHNNVTFFNPVKNIYDKYGDASIYTMSSRSEGFGMVLIEAMSCGLPCVSYNCPRGPKDIITHNEDGFLVENGDIQDFALKINTLIASKELRSDMGQKARLKAQSYLPEKVVPQWDQLFSNLLKKTP